MKNQDLDLDREGWLTEAMQFIVDDIITPEMAPGWKPPHPFRISLGYAPRTTARSKTVAVCIVAEASADHTSEIFISPSTDDSVTVLDRMAHEACHYADNCQSGHKNHFARLARRIGLEGKLTATTAGAELTSKLKDIIDTIGTIPHAAIDLGKAKAKQSTRMIKVFCPDQESCKFSYRASQTNINKISDWLCPACAIEDMKTES